MGVIIKQKSLQTSTGGSILSTQRFEERQTTTMTTVVTVNQPIDVSLQFPMLNETGFTGGVSSIRIAYVPYAEIDDIPFIDDEEEK